MSSRKSWILDNSGTITRFAFLPRLALQWELGFLSSAKRNSLSGSGRYSEVTAFQVKARKILVPKDHKKPVLEPEVDKDREISRKSVTIHGIMSTQPIKAFSDL